MSKTKSGSAKGDPANKRWAFSATISENIAQQGIELHFDNEPHPELQSKLRVKGFLPNKSQVMWYAKKTEATKEFADQVKNALPAFQSGPHLFISPSYEPIKANIENKRFSFVMISLKTGEDISFVLFEPSKPRAEVIAGNFAHNKFGEDLVALAVSPKIKIKEARMLFEEGRIIHEVQHEIKPQRQAPVTIQEAPVNKPEATKPAETMQVTFGGEKANLSLILHEFHKWLKDHPEHKGSTKIDKPVYIQWLRQNHPELSTNETEKLWDRHKRMVKIMSRIGKLDAMQIHVEPYSSMYNNLLELIPQLMELLQAGESFSGKSQVEGYQDLHFDYLFKDKQGYVIALAHYYELNGDLVSDPDMQIRIIPEMNMVEAMTFQNLYRYDEVYTEEDGRELVNTDMKRKLNSYLEEWLKTLISYGHRVKLVNESERHVEESQEDNDLTADVQKELVNEHPSKIVPKAIAEAIPTVSSAGETNNIIPTTENNEHQPEDNEPSNEFSKRAYELLKKIIPDLENVVNQKQDTEATLTFDDHGEKRTITCFFRKGYSQLFIVEEIDGEKHLESDINIDIQNEDAYVTAEWLSDYYADRYDRLDPEGELDGDDMAIGEDMTRGLTEWLDELVDEDHVVKIKGAAPKPDTMPQFAAAYKRLKQVIPEMEKYLNMKKSKKAVLHYQLGEEKKELTCDFLPNKPEIRLIETMNGAKQMDWTILMDTDKKRLRVVKEWLSDYYAEGLGRTESSEPAEDTSLDAADMTRALVQWIDDLLGARLTISLNGTKKKAEDPLAFLNEPLISEGATGKMLFNPVVAAKLIAEDDYLLREWRNSHNEDPKESSKAFTRAEVRLLKDFYNTFILDEADMEEAYRETESALSDDYFEIQETNAEANPAPQYERSYPPAEEKRILDGFNGMGFKSPFGVKEAFDRSLSVTDVGLRIEITEQYYKKEIAGPNRKREKALNAEQKEHKYKTGTKKEAAIRSELWEIGIKLLRGEEYYKRENEIFKDDFFGNVLQNVGKKGFTFSNQADLESFVKFIDGSVFDQNVFDDYHREPINDLVERLIAEYFHAQAKTIKSKTPAEGAIAIDIVRKGMAVPNVLVPAGTKEPFWSDDLYIYDMAQVIKSDFPHLMKLTSSTLFKATPLEMYELAQMSHPNDYGLKVTRDSVLREWEKRGKELFIALGYPIDPDYPYVNINTGYTTVETLNQQLFEYNKEGNHWWGVVEHNRPIADLHKALDYMTRLIQGNKKSMQEYVNPKTKKPKSTHKEAYRDLNFDLGHLEGGKLIIENYLKKTKVPLAKKKTTPAESKPEIPDLSPLSDAFWKPEDEKYPVNKAVLYNQAFDFSRLRAVIEDLLGKQPLTDQHNLVKILAEKFPLATDLEKYAKGLVTIGKSGAKREKVVLAGYVDNTIRQYDIPLKGKREYQVTRFLLDKFLNGSVPGADSGNHELDSQDAEHVEIPFPKTTQLEGRVTIVRKDNDSYLMGTTYTKPFGSFSYSHKPAGDNGLTYFSREAALKAGLLDIQERIRTHLQQKDSIYNSEAKKNMKLKKGLDFLQAFIKEQTNLSQAEPSANTPENATNPGLASALWLQEDEEYPVDKAEIDGVAYHQARLREALIVLIGKLPLEQRLELAEDMSKRFVERRPMQEYFSEHVNGTGKFGKKKFTGAYYDDLIIDNDLKDNSEWKVCKYLISALTKNDALVDQPMKDKPELRKVTKTDQHQLNKQIEALIYEKDQKGASFSAEEKDLLRQYAGSGGLLKQGAKGRGVLYEYYTPDWLVEQMWGLAYKYGYDGGSVLEPSVGTGNFLKYAPANAIVFGFETNHYSARIAQILYPNAYIHEKAFESLFFAGNIHLKDKIDHVQSSLVIGNPPYGEFTGKYAGMGEKKWTGALEYDQYFMLRGLDMLQAGGLMVFLVPSLFIQSGQKYNKIKDKILQKAEVKVCYRLPQNVFATTDIGTDIIVLQKRGGAVDSYNPAGGIDQESLPTTEAKVSMKCDLTGLAIAKGDRIFYDKETNLRIKALKIKGGDNPAEIMQKNPWLSRIIKELFENYMAKHGDRNELREKYYSEDSIYDASLAVDAGLEYIHEVMFDNKVSDCWIHKIDITEAFAD